MAHSHTDSHDAGHVIGLKIHLTILLVLVAFTAITVWAAGINFGNPNFNIIVAMLIASVKAGLVGLYFMHLRYENPLIWMFVTIPIILLFIMIGGLFLDNPTRTVPGKSSYIVSRADGVVDEKKAHGH